MGRAAIEGSSAGWLTLRASGRWPADPLTHRPPARRPAGSNIVSTTPDIVSTKVDIQSLITPNVTRDGYSPPRYTVWSAVTYWSGVAR